MSYFFDWTTFIIQLEHEKLETGFFMSTLPTGEIQFQVDKNLSIMGSWESKIQIKSMYNQKYYRNNGKATHLLIHGNLTKFLQGHSVIGSPDVYNMSVHGIFEILKLLKINPTDIEKQRIKNLDFEVTRLDITIMSRLNNNEDVEQFLRKFAHNATYRNKRVKVDGDTNHIWGTNYIQKKSSYWTFKNYNKLHDLTLAPVSHRIPDYVYHRKKLIEFSEGCVRNELTIRSREMQRFNIYTLNDFKKLTDLESQYNKYRERIQVTDNFKLTDKLISELPKHLVSTYLMWENGLNVRSTFRSRETFRRHRTGLLKYGVDINTLVEKTDSNVVPMIKILEAKPEKVPDWAYHHGLVYHNG